MSIDVRRFSGNTYIITLNGQFALTTANDEDGAQVVLLPLSQEQGQQWQLVDAGNGQCSIRSTSNGKVLGVRDASQDPFAPIVQETPNGANSQLWTLEDAGNEGEGAYQILSANSDCVLGQSLLKIFPPFVAQVPRDRAERWVLQQVG